MIEKVQVTRLNLDELTRLPFSSPSCFICVAILLTAAVLILNEYRHLHDCGSFVGRLLLHLVLGLLLVLPFMVFCGLYLVNVKQIVEQLLSFNLIDQEVFVNCLRQTKDVFFIAVWLSAAFIPAAIVMRFYSFLKD